MLPALNPRTAFRSEIQHANLLRADGSLIGVISTLDRGIGTDSLTPQKQEA